MSNKPMQRVAFVRLSPQGKSYAMRCDRKDLEVDHEVEVLMHAETERAYYDDGVITAISYERWECSCHVVNHISEVTYSFSTDGFSRKVAHGERQLNSNESWRANKAPYLRLVSDSAKSDRSGMREEIKPGSGDAS